MKIAFNILKSIGMFALGLVGLIFLTIFQFWKMKHVYKMMFSNLTMVHLTDKEYRDRITFQTVKTTPSLDQHAEVAKEVKALVEAGKWRRLSETMADWDQNRTACAAGRRLWQTALDTVLRNMTDGVFEGHVCHPDDIYLFSDETVDQMETQAAIHSDSYPLWAIAAQMRCYQGWTSRGADYAEYVTDDGWFGMGQRFAKAEWLLGRMNPVEMNSPLLAATRHELLGFMPDADKFVRPFYEEWSDLDPEDQTPHAKHALMMMPRWFGSDMVFEQEAQRAAIRTADATGDAAYFSMYRRALKEWDSNILSIDIDVLSKGAHDLIDLRGEDPAFVGTLIEEMAWWTAPTSEAEFRGDAKVRWKEIAAGIDDLRKDIVLTRLTAIHPRSWEFRVNGALETISEFIQDEIKDGASFELGEGGLRIIPSLPETELPSALSNQP